MSAAKKRVRCSLRLPERVQRTDVVRLVETERPPARRESERVVTGSRVSTVLLREALDAVLAVPLRDEVLTAAGWSAVGDGPADVELSTTRWVDEALFPRLAERMRLSDAHEIWRQVVEILTPAEISKLTMAPPAPVEPERSEPEKEEPAMRESGVRARKTQRHIRPPKPTSPRTQVPRSRGATVVVASSDLTSDLPMAFLGRDIEAMVITDPNILRLTLLVLGDDVSLVLLDQRGQEDMLEHVDAQSLSGRRVVVWGRCDVTSHATLSQASHRIGCTDEANLGDVVALCASLVATQD